MVRPRGMGRCVAWLGASVAGVVSGCGGAAEVAASGAALPFLHIGAAVREQYAELVAALEYDGKEPAAATCLTCNVADRFVYNRVTNNQQQTT